ncbi:MAG: biotin/lipoyl-binding protein [Syntrophobacterales bacterium]|nr:biotin/lipoyl-binding protein [Syntrophobacterales bacterium]
MKLRTLLLLLAVVAGIVGATGYILHSLRQSSRPPRPGEPVRLEEAPFRVYGLIEPYEREVYVGPLQARRVVAVYVKEGAAVRRGQPLVRLDDDLERRALAVAASRLEEQIRKLALTRDTLRRREALWQKKTIPEFDYSQVQLTVRLEEQQVASARAEMELRRVELDKLTLYPPIDGVVYKLDVRLGEQLTPQDYKRIILGRPEKQVRLFVETFWLHRVKPGDRFVVKEAETLSEIGEGEVYELSPYVGERVRPINHFLRVC